MSARTRACRTVESRMAIAIEGRPLARVLQHLIGLVDLLEVLLGLDVSGIAVGMIFLGELAECVFDVLLTGVSFQAEHFVIVALGHFTCFHGSLEQQAHDLAPKGPELRSCAWRRAPRGLLDEDARCGH